MLYILLFYIGYLSHYVIYPITLYIPFSCVEKLDNADNVEIWKM